ncbi:amidohydrolase family protein [Halomonas urumqiensis]|uniref:Cytosine deaminase n=1 Tax=Halomonas urumqiensis TaxID=1684789 RepID=A0A2N7ULE1_9GAMM|nr:amidohydrolase family protein [Halomonas urumqiensis]PMR81257.1 cytosine deaminase [Halomonas urumqiensis]PTB01732.1 cytosine deaminase [Halomonas urumqiensis]GHE22175.1 cytosine deaminase [Halomonas urumqiensis]
MKTLFTNACVVTMDPDLGELPDGQVLVEDARIVAVGDELSADPRAKGAELIDCGGGILIPGLVNAHMHTWQTGLRGVAANWTLLEYFRHVHRGLAALFTPSDIYIATRMGALNQLNCGTTTLGDWCHNNPTPEHTDAAVRGLKESGIRALFMHGSPKPDPKPGQPHFSEIPHPRHEVERLLAGELADPEGLVTLGLAILGPHYSTLDVTLHDFALAKEFGLVASMHQGGGEAVSPGGWDEVEARGLLGPDINIVHGQSLDDGQMSRFCASGVTFSIAPENEMTQGHGFPVTGLVRRHKGVVSLGVDLESVLSGDMFSVARMALGMQRALDNDASRREQGKIPDTSTITTREALGWITLDGAKALGLDSRVGSLTPGKQADIVLLDSHQLNMQPVNDPISTVVMQASLANVASVMVAGRFKKRDGRLLADLDEGIAELGDSGHRIHAELLAREAQSSQETEQ